ncbi:MAG: hypothetical protein Q4G16_10210 [Cruoricaptor ignavus]|nr:hypothetical protein [Cruoricaptor ignavus]MDO5616555.1 hypothetical protein [Cruoricaptor ignavus]
MKTIVLAVALFSATFFYSQSKYEVAMTEKISAIETQNSLDDWQILSHDFARIGKAEKTEWLPYYYAAFAQIQKGRTMMMQGKTAELDAVTDEAQASLNQAFELSKNNAELYILQKMIHSLKMMVNPMERYNIEGKTAMERLAKAEKLDAENPRITLLKAEDIYFTPEQFGGSKTKGLELFRKALEQFNTYKIASPFHPNWGKKEVEYFLTKKP